MPYSSLLAGDYRVKKALDHLVKLEAMENGMKDLETVVEKIEELHRLISSLKGLPERVESCTR